MLPNFNINSFGWNQKIQMLKVTNVSGHQTFVGLELITTPMPQTIPINFQGVVQPLEVEKLNINLTEERSWEPLQIHTTINLQLNNNDRIIYNQKQYKIVGVFTANQAYGYFEYHLIRDYDATTALT